MLVNLEANLPSYFAPPQPNPTMQKQFCVSHPSQCLLTTWQGLCSHLYTSWLLFFLAWVLSTLTFLLFTAVKAIWISWARSAFDLTQFCFTELHSYVNGWGSYVSAYGMWHWIFWCNIYWNVLNSWYFLTSIMDAVIPSLLNSLQLSYFNSLCCSSHCILTNLLLMKCVLSKYRRWGIVSVFFSLSCKLYLLELPSFGHRPRINTGCCFYSNSVW